MIHNPMHPSFRTSAISMVQTLLDVTRYEAYKLSKSFQYNTRNHQRNHRGELDGKSNATGNAVDSSIGASVCRPSFVAMFVVMFVTMENNGWVGWDLVGFIHSSR